jgi:hypothetical protein
MTTFDACGTIEGFTNDNPTPLQVLQAWATLIKTGACWTLQGFYGRGANSMIEQGYITRDGQITEDGLAICGDD